MLDYEWAKSIGGSSWDIGQSITINASENVCITGYFSGRVVFDPSSEAFYLAANDGRDSSIQKLNTNGIFICSKSLRGLSGDYRYSIATDTSGDAYATGEFGGAVNMAAISGRATKKAWGIFQTGDVLTAKDRTYSGITNKFYNLPNGLYTAGYITIKAENGGKISQVEFTSSRFFKMKKCRNRQTNN